MTIEIWHNPRCTKSRLTLALLEEKGLSPKIVLYRDEPPTPARLSQVLTMLGKAPSDVIRKGEDVYKEKGLSDASDAALIKAMVADPILIERPIVINGDKAAIGRPPEDVLAIL